MLIPKTERLDRLKENIDWCGFQLDEIDTAQIKSLDRGVRTFEVPAVNIKL